MGVRAPVRPRRILGPTALVAAGLAVGQVLGYLLNVVGARVLGSESYGALSSLLALILLANVVSLGVQAVTARRAAVGPAGGDRAAVEPGASALRAGIALTVVGLVLSPVAVALLHLPWIAVLPLVLAFLPLTLTGRSLGLAQGRERFGVLATQYAAAAGLRIGASLVAVLVWADVTAAAIAALIGTALGWLATEVLLGADRPAWTVRDPREQGEVARAAAALLAMFALTTVDVLLARSVLDPDQAGQYAAGAILTKIAFWLPQAVAVAAFPSMSVGDRGALRRALVLLGGLGLLGVGAAALLGPAVVPVVLGDGYPVASASAPVFVLAGAAQAVAYLVLYERLARDDRRAAAMVWGAVVVLVVTGLTFGRTSPVSLAWCVVASATLLVAAGLVARRRSDGGGASE